MNENSFRVLSREDLASRYGSFYERSHKLVLNDKNVPVALRLLVPYAELWGKADDREREELLTIAPKVAQDDLRGVMTAFEHEIDDWLAGPEADSMAPTDEYVAFSAMRMLGDLL